MQRAHDPGDLQTPSDPPGPEPQRDAGEPQLYCPVCSLRLDARKCKLLCLRCGYYMSCSDYY